MSNSFRMLTLIGFFLVTILGFSSAHAAILVNGTGTCLAVKGGSTADSTGLVAAPCFATFVQWDWEDRAIVGLGAIVGTGAPFSEGKCVDVRGGGTASGTVVQLFQCNGTGAQEWRYSGGFIFNPQSDKCLDLGVGGPIEQARIATCVVGKPGQRWSIR